MKVYLAGPINGATDEECYGWRNDMTARLGALGHSVISPMTRDYRGHEDESVTAIVEGDMEDIRSSDVVVAYCPKPSVGTSMEVMYAYGQGKCVIVLAPTGAPVSPWLRYHSHYIFTTAKDAVYAIDAISFFTLDSD